MVANDEHDNRQMDRDIILHIRRDMAEKYIDALDIAAENYLAAVERSKIMYAFTTPKDLADYKEARDNLRGILMQVAEIPERCI